MTLMTVYCSDLSLVTQMVLPRPNVSYMGQCYKWPFKVLIHLIEPFGNFFSWVPHRPNHKHGPAFIQAIFPRLVHYHSLFRISCNFCRPARPVGEKVMENDCTLTFILQILSDFNFLFFERSDLMF